MSTRTRNRGLSYPRLNFKISFFQDLFTIIEELTGDCPGVGLPNEFKVNSKEYSLFKDIQNKHKLTHIFIIDFNKVKTLKEWESIKKISNKYKEYWEKNKQKVDEEKNYLLKNINFDEFIRSLKKVTNKDWFTKNLDVYLTLGYKNSGTYDRVINVIRIGIHQNNKEFLLYTLYHELIHFHIINHMNIKVDEEQEEILCRAIFKSIFKEDQIAQKHWQIDLNKEEIKKINKKVKILFNS